MRRCSECGDRVQVRIAPWRSPHSRAAQRGRPVSVKGHDLCRRCWRALIAPILTAHRAEDGGRS